MGYINVTTPASSSFILCNGRDAAHARLDLSIAAHSVSATAVQKCDLYFKPKLAQLLTSISVVGCLITQPPLPGNVNLSPILCPVSEIYIYIYIGLIFLILTAYTVNIE